MHKHGHSGLPRREEEPIRGVSRLMHSVRRLRRGSTSKTSAAICPSEPIPQQSDPSIASSQRRWLREIKSQMQGLTIPVRWRVHQGDGQSSLQVLNGNDVISGDALVASVQESIERLEYLIRLEEQRINASNDELKELVDHLESLDRKAQQLNTQIALARSQGLDGMRHILNVCTDRAPTLRALWNQHRNIVAAIEEHRKRNRHSENQFELLRIQAQAARKREAMWARIKRWGPTATMLSFVILLTIINYWFA